MMVLVAVSQGWAQQELGHYPNGEEGIKACSVPPGPGVYARLYLNSYSAGTQRNGAGQAVDIGVTYESQCAAFCGIVMTPLKVMDADYGMFVVVPLLRQTLAVELAGLKETRRGLADINLTPIMLSWHSKQADYLAYVGTYIPTGDFDHTSPINNGYGFQTYMASAGCTYYPDKEKSWSIAAIARYELEGKKKGIDVTPGDRFEFDWAVSKNVAQVWQVGVAGFGTWQVSDDTGADVTWDASAHDRSKSLGPEINLFVWPAKVNVSLRYLQEFAVIDRMEGHSTWLTLTQMF
jgi:hypothetical protein